MVNLQQLIDDAKCFGVVRELRWPDGVRCPDCGQQFDDLSGTIFEGHHQPLRVWVMCL